MFVSPLRQPFSRSFSSFKQQLEMAPDRCAFFSLERFNLLTALPLHFSAYDAEREPFGVLVAGHTSKRRSTCVRAWRWQQWER